MGPRATSIGKGQFKGLSVYVGVCGTQSYCHNELCKHTCEEDRRKKIALNVIGQ